MSQSQTSSCRPIPVAAAKNVSAEYAKSMVVILGYDPSDQRVYCATYGASAVGKDLAAAMGEIAVAAIGGVLDFKQSFEDFRATPEAESKAEIERLTKERDAARERLRSEGAALRGDITALVARAERAEGQIRGVEPLLSATEQLLAELGVTEPGAGEDNHETPAATLMDNLYEAWNNYMRAKHGQADAIFEPEGE